MLQKYDKSTKQPNNLLKLFYNSVNILKFSIEIGSKLVLFFVIWLEMFNFALD